MLCRLLAQRAEHVACEDVVPVKYHVVEVRVDGTRGERPSARHGRKRACFRRDVNQIPHDSCLNRLPNPSCLRLSHSVVLRIDSLLCGSRCLQRREHQIQGAPIPTGASDTTAHRNPIGTECRRQRCCANGGVAVRQHRSRRHQLQRLCLQIVRRKSKGVDVARRRGDRSDSQPRVRPDEADGEVVRRRCTCADA